MGNHGDEWLVMDRYSRVNCPVTMGQQITSVIGKTREKSLFLWPCSIAMLNYQKVSLEKWEEPVYSWTLKWEATGCWNSNLESDIKPCSGDFTHWSCLHVFSDPFSPKCCFLIAGLQHVAAIESSNHQLKLNCGVPLAEPHRKMIQPGTSRQTSQDMT